MIKIWMLLLAFSVSGFGCGENGLSLEIHYNDVRGLSAGDRVVYEDISIGKVAEITRKSADDYAVRIQVQKDFEHLLTEHARFFIIPDTTENGRKAVELTRQRKGGVLLAEGARIEGSVRMAERYRQGLDEFRRGLDELKDELESFSDQMSRFPESEEYQQLKRKLEEWAEELKRSGKEARDRFEREILPRLQQELEELKDKLKKRKKEETQEPLQV